MSLLNPGRTLRTKEDKAVRRGGRVRNYQNKKDRGMADFQKTKREEGVSTRREWKVSDPGVVERMEILGSWQKIRFERPGKNNCNCGGKGMCKCSYC